MSESSTRAQTPVTARSSLAPSSLPARKIRLRIVTHTPSLQFLAPFSHDDPHCFEALQRFVHTQLVKRARSDDESRQVESIAEQAVQFEIDGFDVPFDDPEILRDGDTLTVRLDQHPHQHLAQHEHDETEQDEEEQDLERGIADEEERYAVLEAARVAAMLRAGMHRLPTDDDAAPSRSDPDLPRMPATAPTPASKATRTKTSAVPSLPTMPLPLSSSGGAAAAMTAFEARRKQMQRTTTAAVAASDSDSNSHATTSSSEGSSSEDSDSSSSDSSDSDSESSSSSSSSSGSSSDSSSGPSEEATFSDRAHIGGGGQVPPGQGTARTKRRNQMRRLKQQLERNASTSDSLDAWVDDRTPAYRIQSPVSASALRTDTLPPGAGALGIDESAPRKRKRDDTTEEVQHAGMGVRHIDCDAYYDSQLSALSTRTAADEHASDAQAVAKRIKLEPSDTDIVAESVGAVEAAWTRIYALTPAQLSRLTHGPVAGMATMKVGVPLVVRQLALHPHTRSPAHLLHAAVVTSVGDSDIHVQLTAPLLDDDPHWPDSPTESAVWSHSNLPSAWHI